MLIHRPGREIDWMVPAMMERLLFDDILYSERAREEHDAFRDVLQAAGVETLDPQDLLAECLADEDVRTKLLARMEKRRVADDVLRELDDLDPAAMSAALINGIRVEPTPGSFRGEFYRLPPIPNYFFQRDPQIVVGDRVVISSMATDARRREPLLARTVFESHPALSDGRPPIRLYEEGSMRRSPVRHLEGGDVLVPTSDLLMVGLSERTNRRGIEALARKLHRAETGFRNLIVVEVPAKRSYMHLDTVFTFIDRDLCLAYLPVIAPRGGEAGAVYGIDLTADRLRYTVCDDVPAALAEVGIEVDLIPCGGSASLIDQQREQWTDGANAFAIAPRVLLMYHRNQQTTEELRRRGFRVVTGEDVVAGREEVLGQGPTVVTLKDHELSRARGGPRCMTMPLERDDPPT